MDGEVELEDETVSGEGGGDVGRVSLKVEFVDTSRGESEVSSDWIDRLVQGFTVALDQEERST